jgi:L-ascorbate metabolism protein UlaG (beta-lactamase superfamily)
VTRLKLPDRTFAFSKPFTNQVALITQAIKVSGGPSSYKPPAQKLYFAGDTAYGSHFKRVEEMFGPVDMAVLPIGAYEPHALIFLHHMNPAEAVQAHLDLKSCKSIGIHFNVFNSAADRYDQPIDDLRNAEAKANLPGSTFVAPRPGEVVSQPCHAGSLRNPEPDRLKSIGGN